MDTPMARRLSPALYLGAAVLIWLVCLQSALAAPAEGLRSDFASATRHVERRYGGQVIAVAPAAERARAVKVKVLLDDGRVKTLVVDAETGEILDQRGARR